MTCTRAHTSYSRPLLGAGRGREYEIIARVDNITRVHLRMRASNCHGFCDNAEGFARMCLIEASEDKNR